MLGLLLDLSEVQSLQVFEILREKYGERNRGTLYSFPLTQTFCSFSGFNFRLCVSVIKPHEENSLIEKNIFEILKTLPCPRAACRCRGRAGAVARRGWPYPGEAGGPT